MDLEGIIRQFNKLTENPESFLSHDELKVSQIESVLKNVYDTNQQYLGKRENDSNSSALPKLMVDGFSTEQVWQQIDLLNDQFLCSSIPHITKHVVNTANLTFNLNYSAQDKSDSDDSNHGETNKVKKQVSFDGDIQVQSSKPDRRNKKENTSDDESGDSEDDINFDIQSNSDGSDDDKVEDNDESPHKNKQMKKSDVDDDFFNLQEMDDFLDGEDKKDMLQHKQNGDIESDDSENEMNSTEINLFSAMSDEENDNDTNTYKNPKYAEFFVKTDPVSDKGNKRNKYLAELDQQEGDTLADRSEEESNIKEKSGFDLRQERLNKKIATFERLAVGEKSWQLKGEINAECRPENSLLENVLEFDMSTRPAPVITEETTMRLEDMIRQRIQDRVWDSVQRKQKPLKDLLLFKKQLVMDGEKNKLSLAQIYEKDYLKQQKSQQAEDKDDKEKEDTPQQADVRKMMSSLISKLDALSNYHFTPKLANPELKIVTNLPAISMEEVAPLAASDAALLAPEEVQRRNKGKKGAAPLGLQERTDADKKRQRRTKKRKQKIHASNIAAKSAIPTNKYTKEKASKMLDQLAKDKNIDKMTDFGSSKSVKSSTAFFEQLQDQVKSSIKGNISKKQKKIKTSLQAKRFKL